MKKKLKMEGLKVLEDTVKLYHKATKSIVLKVFKNDIDYDKNRALEAIKKALDTGIIVENGKWLVWCGD